MQGTLRDNPEPYGSYEWRKLETHFGANVICVKWQPKEGSQLFAAGSANKNIAICHAEQNASVTNCNSVRGRSVDPVRLSRCAPVLTCAVLDIFVCVIAFLSVSVLRKVHASGPVLCLHFNPARPELLLATCMNGGHTIVNVEADEADAVLHTSVAHKKFVVTGKWSPDGLHYITGSHDGFVHVYRAQDGNLSANAWPQVGSVELGNNVEALEWVDATSFYVSVREDNYLHHVSVADGGVREVGKINVNESGDDHVSFNVLDMALAPGGQSIMLATDRHRCILMQKGCSHQIRNFYNIVNDGYSTPRLAWSPSGKHAYVTSQDKCVAVLEIASGRTVHKITGHNINVRDAAMHPFENKLLTGSYDQTCRVWTPAVE